MLLTVDVGNTNIKFGIFDGDDLKFKLRAATDKSKTPDEFAVELYTFFQIQGIDKSLVTASIISSVVPQITPSLKEAIKTVLGVESLVTGPGVKNGLNIKIDRPETLGADIVAGCVGASAKYGYPIIVIFMGTATAITYVDQSGIYRGGAIAPGVGISLDALIAHGALLPSVDLKAPPCVIGKNTVDCMRSGIMYGTACMLDGMIDRFLEQAGEGCKIIATGGLAGLMTQNCRHEIIYDENLILTGLNETYKRNI